MPRAVCPDSGPRGGELILHLFCTPEFQYDCVRAALLVQGCLERLFGLPASSFRAHCQWLQDEAQSHVRALRAHSVSPASMSYDADPGATGGAACEP